MLIAFFAGLVGIVGLDQLTKYFAVAHLKGIRTLPLIEEVFHLTYVENPGAGFGIFADYTWLLSVCSAVIAACLIGYVLVKKPKHPLMLCALIFLTGGAIGNLIDRVSLGHVVDFLDFTWINFPVFNVADCFVTVGAVLLAVYIVFYAEDSAEKQNIEKQEAEKKE